MKKIQDQYTNKGDVPKAALPYVRYSPQLYDKIRTERQDALAALTAAQDQTPTEGRQDIIDGIVRSLDVIRSLLESGRFSSDVCQAEDVVVLDKKAYYKGQVVRLREDLRQLKELEANAPADVKERLSADIVKTHRFLTAAERGAKGISYTMVQGEQQ